MARGAAEETVHVTRTLTERPADRLGQRAPGKLTEVIRQRTSMRALRT